MTTNRWTKKELNTLTRMRADGTPYKAIAEKLGRTTASVQQKAHKLALKKSEKKFADLVDGLAKVYEDKREVQLELPLDDVPEDTDIDIEKLAVETWKRPSRKYIAGGVYMPSTISETVDELVVAIDTSGSVSSRALTEFLSEVVGDELYTGSLTKPKTVDVDDLDKLEWVEKEPVDQLARAVDLYVPLAGGVMAGVLIGASLAMWML